MTDAFIRSAEQHGHTVQRFDAAFLKIGGCHACMSCYKTGKACTFDDDFNRIAPAILESDVVVFTMPVYWYTIPAQIKGVIDRLFSLVVGGQPFAGKKCALIACCEEEDRTVLDGRPYPHGTNGRPAEMGHDRRSPDPRRPERRRYQPHGRLPTSRSLGRTAVTHFSPDR